MPDVFPATDLRSGHSLPALVVLTALSLPVVVLAQGPPPGAREGSGYTVEYWNKDPPKTYKRLPVPTEVTTGQLRLVREGETVHFLVADGPGQPFRLLDEMKLGTEDLAYMHFEVVDSGTPGNS